MHSVKEKVSNAAAEGKEKIDIMKAKAEEEVLSFSILLILIRVFPPFSFS